MKLLFLGVSSALSVGRNTYHSNMMIESASNKKMLIDCGGDIRHSLFEQGYRHSDISAVYISHLHADHTGGLEWFGFAKYFIDKEKPALYISPDQVETLWNHVLSGGMSSLENEKASLSLYFDVGTIDHGQFEWENIPFQLIKTHHAFNHSKLLPSYGLFIEGHEKKIFISTDTRMHLQSLTPAYEAADIIFQDCETSSCVSGQHAHYNELKTLNTDIKNKMWLYDYNSGPLPPAEQDGFLGFVTLGQCFNF